jgi:two-component system, sensor histidine kinase and response regulator
MLDDMLVVAQMETNNLVFEPQQVNIQEFLQRIVDEFQSIYRETYQIIYESQFNDEVMADPRLLRQIAANLISNAIKYSSEGKRIYVLLKQENGQVVLTMRDQGIGIPDADQTRLFQAFQRASNVGAVRGRLGLAIVQQAATLHQGDVHIESKVGVGTKVTVKFPVLVA